MPALKLEDRRVQGTRVARALDGFADLHDQVAAHPCAGSAHELLPAYPEIPAFLPFS